MRLDAFEGYPLPDVTFVTNALVNLFVSWRKILRHYLK